MKRNAKIASALIVGVMLATSALTQIYSSTPPTFPTGWYVGPPAPFTFESAALTNAGIASIDLNNLVHTPVLPLVSSYYSNSINSWVETFNSTLTGAATINLLGGGSIAGNLFAGGSDENVMVTIPGNSPPGGTVGSWVTSLTILDWPAMITYDNTTNNIWLQCLGGPGLTTVTEISPSLYEGTSVFDITPEISLDNTVWTTADQEGYMTLIPEPSSLALLGCGALGLAIKTLRSRK